MAYQHPTIEPKIILTHTEKEMVEDYLDLTWETYAIDISPREDGLVRIAMEFLVDPQENEHD